MAVFLSCGAAGQTNVGIPDPNLESVIRSVLEKTNAPLTAVDMLGLTNLTSWAVVTNLSGLEYAVNLDKLVASTTGNPASLASLSGLLHLRSLSLEHYF